MKNNVELEFKIINLIAFLSFVKFFPKAITINLTTSVVILL